MMTDDGGNRRSQRQVCPLEADCRSYSSPRFQNLKSPVVAQFSRRGRGNRGGVRASFACAAFALLGQPLTSHLIGQRPRTGYDHRQRHRPLHHNCERLGPVAGPERGALAGLWRRSLTDRAQLAEWIQQGVGRRVDFVKAEMKGNRMAIFQVDDLGVAMQIQKLNGRKFHGKSVRWLALNTSHPLTRLS